MTFLEAEHAANFCNASDDLRCLTNMLHTQLSCADLNLQAIVLIS